MSKSKRQMLRTMALVWSRLTLLHWLFSRSTVTPTRLLLAVYQYIGIS